MTIVVTGAIGTVVTSPSSSPVIQGLASADYQYCRFRRQISLKGRPSF